MNVVHRRGLKGPYTVGFNLAALALDQITEVLSRVHHMAVHRDARAHAAEIRSERGPHSWDWGTAYCLKVQEIKSKVDCLTSGGTKTRAGHIDHPDHEYYWQIIPRDENGDHPNLDFRAAFSTDKVRIDETTIAILKCRNLSRGAHFAVSARHCTGAKLSH